MSTQIRLSRIVIFVLCFAYVCMPLAKCADVGSEPSNRLDQTSPEGTIHSFVKAINKSDVPAAARCVIGGKSTEGLKEMWQAMAKVLGGTYSVDKLSLSIENDNATAQLQIKMQVSNTSLVYPEQIKLRRVGNIWKIVPDPTAGFYKPSKGLLQDRVVMLIDPEEPVGIFRKAKATAQRLSCFKHVQELAAASLKFAHDHQGRFMLQADKLKKALQPYVKSDDAFKCQAPTSSSFSYSFNRNLERVRKSSVKNPAKTVLIYEGGGQRLSFRHTDRITGEMVAVVALVDGTVRYVTKRQANTLLWRP